MPDVQVDVFSFGVIMYEVLIRQVTSAVVSQSGDINMSEMYASKVSLCCKLYLAKRKHLQAALPQNCFEENGISQA